MITIIDYGLGNLSSIKKMVKKVGGTSIITSDLDQIKNANKLLLPGVGSFDKGIENLNKVGFVEVLGEKVLEEKTPILGICLGMQLLTNHSEEGNVDGLGWIDAKTVRFDRSKIDASLKVPHMGWTDIRVKSTDRLFAGDKSDVRYYFVHSYHVVCNDEKDIMCTANYGYEYTCGIRKGNIMGVQFHPEKSHRLGMQLMRNFVNNF